MTDKLKALSKQLHDTEKRLKLAEDRIKVLADSLTKPKDIEKMLDVLYNQMRRDPELSNKVVMREVELSEKLRKASDREREKEFQKQQKDYDQMSRKAVDEAQLRSVQTRLDRLEAMVATLRR